MIERQDIHERSKPQFSRALGDRGKEHSWRWRHPERREMMFRNVIAEESETIESFRELQALFVELLKRDVGPVHVVEHAEFH
jgi:hypothetical protein